MIRTPWSYATARILSFLFALVLWVAYSGAPLAIGLLSRIMYDQIADAVALPTSIAVLYLLAVLTGELIHVTWIRVHSIFEDGLGAELQISVLHRIVDTPGASTTSMAPSEVMNRVKNDTIRWLDPINEHYRLVGDVAFGIGALAIMVSDAGYQFVLTLLPVIFIVSLGHYLGRWLSVAHGQSRQAASRVSGFVGEIIRSAISIAGVFAQRSTFRQFRSIDRQRARAEERLSGVTAVIDFLNASVITVATGCTILLAGSQIRRGTLSVGDFALLVIYLEWVLNIPRRVGRLISARHVSRTSKERLLQIPGIRA